MYRKGLLGGISMDVRNCKNCGKLYNYFGGQPLCPSCFNDLEDKFKLVKEYIYDHPQCGIQEVSEEFEVSIQIIHRWIREERLSFSENSDVGLECERCGVMVRTGRYCKACKDTLANNLNNIYKKDVLPPEKKKAQVINPKMRYFSE